MSKKIGALLLLLATTLPGVDALATGEGLTQSVDDTVGIHQDTQALRDGWADERAELVARFKRAEATVAYLSDRHESISEKALALRERVEELERRITESDRLQACLQDTLGVVMARLEKEIAQDLPFLKEERDARIVFLNKELARPDLDGAEKLRRLLEALQIETEYGGSVEVYQEAICVGGERIFADILRIGRISAFWSTPDGARVGEYDRRRGAWVELSDKYRRNIEAAMEMAARMRPIEIIDLPLGRIQP